MIQQQHQSEKPAFGGFQSCMARRRGKAESDPLSAVDAHRRLLWQIWQEEHLQAMRAHQFENWCALTSTLLLSI